MINKTKQNIFNDDNQLPLLFTLLFSTLSGLGTLYGYMGSGHLHCITCTEPHRKSIISMISMILVNCINREYVILMIWLIV